FALEEEPGLRPDCASPAFGRLLALLVQLCCARCVFMLSGWGSARLRLRLSLDIIYCGSWVFDILQFRLRRM
ncbi:hypothetical protein B5P44_00005, partial [Mycobacterium sp. CBMA 213]|nr:hypothetical protein [Mycolicibacterium sp. CBMA 213]